LGEQATLPFTALVLMAYVVNAEWAETVVGPKTRGMQDPVPLHSPPQPLKGRPTGSCAVATQEVVVPKVTGFGLHCALAMPSSLLTVTVYWRGAWQATVAPPWVPAQFQRKASDVLLIWLAGEPALHKKVGQLSEGAVSPHAPWVGGGVKLALMVQSPVMSPVVKVLPESAPPQPLA
jgi:hypothetical protein